MQVTFYVNTSDNRVVSKSLTTLLSDVIIQNQPINRDKPTFTVKFNEQLLKSNYCYIDVFDRYYYIDNIETQGQTLSVICEKCDVLMSFKKFFKSLDALVTRQSNRYNTYLADEKVEVYSNCIYTTKRFPNSVRQSECYILLINGGSN